MNDNGYINIQGWMINRLGLKGNELILFALIFGFSQDGQLEFYGSTRYIQKSIGISRGSVMALLHKLMEKGLIQCNSQSHYSVVQKLYQSEKEVVQKLYQSGTETVPESGTETVPNIYNNNNKDNNMGNIPKKGQNFIKPTLDEVTEYCTQRGNKIDAQYFIDYYETRGWKIGKNSIKDWKACVRTWERNNISSNKPVANVFMSDKSNDKLQKAQAKVY